MLNSVIGAGARTNRMAVKGALLAVSAVALYFGATSIALAPLVIASLCVLCLSIAFAGVPFSYIIAVLNSGAYGYFAYAHSAHSLAHSAVWFGSGLVVFGFLCFLLSTLASVIPFLRPGRNRLLAREHAEFKKLREFIYRPYVNSYWSMSERLQAIKSHYLLVENTVPLLQLRNDQSLEVTAHDLAEDKLRIVIDRPQWMRGEGELGISLFYGVDRIYTAMFLLARTGGDLQMIVGNLQGDGRDRQALYKEFTKKMHGMRPRDYLIHVLKMLGEELGCKEIFGISDDAHRSSHWLTNAKKLSTYDAIWLEQGGVKDESSGFFRISSRLKKRADDEVPANKRALYRRRYQYLDEMQLKIRAFVSSHPQPGSPPQ